MVFFTDAMSQCRKDWSQYGNQCFYVNTNALSYRDAKAHCQSFGGGANIASISDSGTNSHVSSLLVSSDRYYIGKNFIEIQPPPPQKRAQGKKELILDRAPVLTRIYDVL